MTIPLDPKYIPAFSIEDVILDKDTGVPLSGGLVYFEYDNQRGLLKPVYQITGTSPDYTFIQLPNPVTLSSIGTFADAMDNPEIPYFYPYDAEGNVDLYYVRVTSSEDVPQFTREAQPYIATSGDSDFLSVITNEIANPQFAEVLFDTSEGAHTFSVNTVTDYEIPIAPDWVLIITAPAAGSVTVTQLDPAGSVNVTTNPGTILTITSAGLTKLQLRQRKFGSPNLWGSGYISASFVAKTYSGTSVTLNMYYSQSNGTVVDQLLVAGSLASSGVYGQFSGSALIPPSTSSETFPDAYIDIFFDIPLSTQIDITSIMLAFTGVSSIANIGYDEESVDRQIDHLFHYYKPQLQYKPIPSYLVGWDFALNPAQLGSSFAAQAVGANKSYYTWDQTIVFQSANSGITVSREATAELFRMLSAPVGGTQMAVIQYLTGKEAQSVMTQMTSGGLSVNVEVSSTVSQTFTASLWWTANGTLPNVASGTNNSLVSTLDADGYPDTVVAGWLPVERANLGIASITTTDPTELHNYAFTGWEDSAALSTGTFFAIVIGCNTVAQGNAIQFRSISLVPGYNPTIPAPQTSDEVLRECQRYYETTFLTGATVPSAVTGGQLQAPMISSDEVGNVSRVYANTFGGQWVTPKWSAPNVLFYSGTTTTASRVQSFGFGDTVVSTAENNIGTFWAAPIIDTKTYLLKSAGTAPGNLIAGVGNTLAGTPVSAWIQYHYTADARPGIKLS